MRTVPVLTVRVRTARSATPHRTGVWARTPFESICIDSSGSPATSLTDSRVTRLSVACEVAITRLRTSGSETELPTVAASCAEWAWAVALRSESLELISRLCRPGATYR